MIKEFRLMVHNPGEGERYLLMIDGSLSTSKDVLAVARDLLSKEKMHLLKMIIIYTEGGLEYRLILYDLGNNTVKSTIEIRGLRPPETLIADLPGKPLSELIQGSTVVDDVIGDQIIVECQHSAIDSCLTVDLEGTKEGWWFMR